MSLWITANEHQFPSKIPVPRTSGRIRPDFSQYLTQLGVLFHILPICITFLNKCPQKGSTRKIDELMSKSLTVIFSYCMFRKRTHKPPKIEMWEFFNFYVYIYIYTHKCFLHVSRAALWVFFIHHRIPKCMYASSPVVSPRHVSNKRSFGECHKSKLCLLPLQISKTAVKWISM